MDAQRQAEEAQSIGGSRSIGVELQQQLDTLQEQLTAAEESSTAAIERAARGNRSDPRFTGTSNRRTGQHGEADAEAQEQAKRRQTR